MNSLSDTINQPNDFRLGALRMMPIAASAVPFGLALGAMAVQKGISPFEIALMGLLVFTGAAQFVAVELWADPIPVLTILGITAVVNLRHILMSISLSPTLRPHGTLKSHIGLYFMTDEVWALCMQRRNENGLSMGFYTGCALTIGTAWVISLYSGALAGAVIQDPAKWGLDFAGTAIFLTLICGFWEGHKTSLLPWVSAGAVALITHTYIDGSWYIITGSISAMIVRAMFYKQEVPHA